MLSLSTQSLFSDRLLRGLNRFDGAGTPGLRLGLHYAARFASSLRVPLSIHFAGPPFVVLSADVLRRAIIPSPLITNDESHPTSASRARDF